LPEPGENFLGFHLIRNLGRGAVGRVYLAKQGGLADRLVVLKVAPQLWGESQSLARLQHTNIVPVYSTHEENGLQAICMPYLGAVTLAEALRKIHAECLPASGDFFRTLLRHADYPGAAAAVALEPMAGRSYADAVLWIGLQLARGLAHAHQRGLAHCDIKPANILLSDDGVPMLLDFNVAVETCHGSKVANVMGGTLAYMSPEQLLAVADRPIHLDGRTDVFSLGLVLFELLAGKPPYDVVTDDAGTVFRQLTEACDTAGFDLRRANPAVTPATEAIVLKCLHPDVAKRYQTAAALAEDLERQLDHRPLTHAGEPSAAERARKWVRRNRWLTSGPAIACGVAMLLFGAAAVSLTVARQRKIDEFNKTVAMAADQFADARLELQSAQMALATANDDLAAKQKGEAALARYGVRNDADWAARDTVRFLPVDDRRRLLEDADTLLFLLDRANRVGAADLRAKQADTLTTAERFRLACDHAANRRDADALTVLQHVCRAEPDHVGAWFLRGHTHARLRQFGDAAGAFSTCIVLRPRLAQAFFQRGLAYHAMRDYPQALTDFDQVVRLEPGYAEGFVRRGVTRQFLNRFAAAADDFTAAIDLGERTPRLFILRSRSKAWAGDAGGAEADMDRAMTIIPTDEGGWVERGLGRFHQPHPGGRVSADPAKAKAAASDFEAALKINSRSYPALQNLSMIYCDHARDDAKAAAVLETMRKHYPDDILVRRAWAVVCARLGQIDEALREAAACRRIDSTPLALYQLAGVYAHAGKSKPEHTAEAIRLLAWAVSQGYGGPLLETDIDTEPLRAHDGFRKIVASYRELTALGR